ncbi:MAG: shikimate dehydrogenase [Pseudobutyrivibrio sp.]|nr:shikimate dehydrogenase [Pseudobutyrivibrio sp.]
MIPLGTTQLTCLLGHPVAHSMSPAMHNNSFKKLGLDYTYLAFDIDENHIKEAIDALKLFNCRGFNLTMPLKQAVIPYLDEISDAAKLCNSVNTVVIDNGRLTGHTTDGIGYMDALKDKGYIITGKVMTLLGAGGAATSVATQAALDGVSEIRIFKRNNSSFIKAVSFAENLSKNSNCLVSVHDMADLDDLGESINDSAIVVNGTNVGMGSDNTSLIPIEFFRKDLIVSDLIYHPSKTKMLLDAEYAGSKIINGKYMLLFQGAAAFKLWTNMDMPIEYIKEKCFSED